jgi:hypothetical protein
MAKITVRGGMPSVQLDKAEFKKRFLAKFYDPDFEPLKGALEKIADTAWKTYDEYHKSPRTRKACAWRIRKLRCDRHLEQTAAMTPPGVVGQDGAGGQRLARSFSRSAPAE